MHGEGKWSLIRLFTQVANVGAEWVMWILIALSVFSIAIMLERTRFYWSLSDDLEALARDLRDFLRGDDLPGARQRLERSNSPAATVALAGLNEAERGPDAASEAMEGAAARTRLALERNLAFLGTVGNNAPFVGLLGTVIGIIQAFDALKSNQTAAAAGQQAGNAAAALASAQQTLGATGKVMGNIAEALVATAIGLFVAIPAVAAFNYFQRKVRSISASSETLSHVVMAHLRGTPVGHLGPLVVPATAARPNRPNRLSSSPAGSSGSDVKREESEG
jgi:biopolymer transport protein ExbB/TolQ